MRPEHVPVDPLSNRGRQWMRFHQQVLEHIEDYTVPQYGDAPDDPVSDFTTRDIIVNMRRYLSRVDSNARGRQETLRDCLKLAHYACLLHAAVGDDIAQ